MTISAGEFIRRFLLHVLPGGLPSDPLLRFPWQSLPPTKLAQCRDVLGMPVPEPSDGRVPKEYRDRHKDLTGFPSGNARPVINGR